VLVVRDNLPAWRTCHALVTKVPRSTDTSR
jgi:hypothetical protein